MSRSFEPQGRRFALMGRVLGAGLFAWALTGCVATGGTPLAMLGDLSKTLPPTSAGPSESAPAAAGSVKPSTPGAHGTPRVGVVEPLVLSKAAELELLPDRECKRPREKFNIVEKLVEWGGASAQFHVARLLSSEFDTAKPSPAERKLLKLLAYGTVWIPVELESAIMRTVGGLGGQRSELDDFDVDSKKLLEKRLDALKAHTTDFPENIRLDVEKDVPDGAWAQMGAVIQVGVQYMGLMESSGHAQHFVMAHEMSHIYKRHRVKQLQARLLLTPTGWKLAQTILKPLVSPTSMGFGANPWESLKTFLQAGTTLQQLAEEYRKMDLKFTDEQELEADACTVTWLRAAKVDTCAAWTSYEQISQQSGLTKGTHSPTADRKANYMKKVQGLPCEQLRSTVKAASSKEVKPAAKPLPAKPASPGTADRK